MIAVQNILFKPGRILATPACLEELERAGQNIWEFIGWIEAVERLFAEDRREDLDHHRSS